MQAEILGLSLNSYTLFLTSMLLFMLMIVLGTVFVISGLLDQAKVALPSIYSVCLLAFVLGAATVGGATTGLRLFWELSDPPKMQTSKLRYVLLEKPALRP